MKKIIWFILGFLMLGGIVQLCDNDENKIPPAPKPDPDDPEIVDFPKEKTYAEKVKEDYDFYLSIIEGLKQFKLGDEPVDIGDITIKLGLIKQYTEYISEIKFHEVDSVKKLSLELEKVLSTVQLSEFPKLRKKYAEISRNKLWENDIEVSATGKNFTTINYTGGIFAANKSKKEFQEKLHSMLYQLRFKKSIYRFTEYDKKYTYYTIDSPGDSDLVVI